MVYFSSFVWMAQRQQQEQNTLIIRACIFQDFLRASRGAELKLTCKLDASVISQNFTSRKALLTLTLPIESDTLTVGTRPEKSIVLQCLPEFE